MEEIDPKAKGKGGAKQGKSPQEIEEEIK